MKKMIIPRSMKNRYAFPSLLLIAGFFLGWLFFHGNGKTIENQDHLTQTVKATIWTCAMHPQIRKTEPGKCPICGMDLITVSQSGGDSVMDPSTIHFTQEAVQLANVLTSVVSRQKPVKEIRLYGKVQADERLMQSQVSHIPGRIEKLMVNFTGETVRKGQPLAVIYSPELVNAQQELLEAAKMKDSQPEIFEAAKDKLRQWKLSEEQVNAIVASGAVQNNFEFFSGTSGVVTARKVNNGDYISQGTVLFEVADLSHLWVMFDAYESDLPFLKKGDLIDFTVQALPGNNFKGNILFIDPVIDPYTRVAKVRVEIGNQAGKLKPEMFATGMIKASLDNFRDNLVIPQSAVLWTGKRSIVYVKQPGSNGSMEPIFKMREIELGPMLGNSYVVVDGLHEGEEIVTAGAFSVDAAAQLQGIPSMMNPSGAKVSSMPGMDMPGDIKTNNVKETPGKKTPAVTKPQKDNSMPGMDMPGDTKNHPMVSGKAMIQHEQFHVSGNCDLCKERIEKAAKSVDGVVSAKWDETSKKIHVEFDNMKTNLMQIQTAIAKAGHDSKKVKADDKTYKALPECCKYRK